MVYVYVMFRVNPPVEDPVDPVAVTPDTDVDPCAASPCGPGAICTSEDDRYRCTCQPGYFGNPYQSCSPECTVNSDCPSNRACVSLKCVDPCPGSCGINANCQVLSHAPNCYCEPGYTGNPYRRCFIERRKDEFATSFNWTCFCFSDESCHIQLDLLLLF